MTTASTPGPLSEAKTQLSDSSAWSRQQHERITRTRNGEAEAVLMSVDDLDGLSMTLEILRDAATVGRIKDGLVALDSGDAGADMTTVRADLARRRATGGWTSPRPLTG